MALDNLDWDNRYPRIMEIIRHISRDNDIPLRELIDWPLGLPYSQWELALDKLTDDERYRFAVGDQTEQQEIFIKYDIEEIHSFFDDVFDGPFYHLFFEE